MRKTLSINNSRGYAVFLSLLPIVMMYKVPIIEIGISTTMIIIGMIYAAIAVFFRIRRIDYLIVSPIVVYFLYCIPKNDVSSLLVNFAVLLHLAAISTGSLNSLYLKKTIVKISAFASVCVMMQFTFHYVFHIHIPLIISDLCLDDLKYYNTLITTGYSRYSIDSIYRCSAFFLEPSHFAQYCVIGLVISLFDVKPNYKVAGLISAGMVLTTSGMGIVLCGATWAVYPFFSNRRLSTKAIRRTVIIYGFFAVAFLLLRRTPFFINALARITGPVQHSRTQYNAIWGRTLYWSEYIPVLSKHDLFLGKGITSVPDVFFTGLMTLIYAYGIVGTALFFAPFIVLFIFGKEKIIKILIPIYAALVCFADIIGFIYVIFYLGLLTSLYKEKSRSNNVQLVS